MVTFNGFQSLNIITKHSILGVAAVLDSPLIYTLIIYLIIHVFLWLLSPNDFVETKIIMEKDQK